MRILIADDNSIVRVDLRAALEEAGHEVCAEAADGLAAVELARATKPELAILDVRMPRLHGIEAARRIRRERDIPIVILTGYSAYSLSDLAAATDAGASYVAKPFTDDELLLGIEEALLQHRRRRRGGALGSIRSRLRGRGAGRISGDR